MNRPAPNGRGPAVPAGMPRALRRVASAVQAHPVARIVVRTATGLTRLEIFDRAMTIAAQAFTSIFPVLILIGALVGRRLRTLLEATVDLSAASRQLLGEAFGGGGVGAFGVVGSVAVLISATSLARALGRAYGYLWAVRRLPAGLAATWRWLATILLLVVFIVGTRILGWLAGLLPHPHVSLAVLSLLVDGATTVLLPWLLLGGAVPVRMLAPGACVFALAMLVVRPVGAVYLPRALQISDDRYGTIGLAFTYISWLYVLSFCLLATAVLGRELAADDGALGRFVRGKNTPDAIVTRIDPVGRTEADGRVDR